MIAYRVAFGNGLKEIPNNRTLARALEYAATFDLTVVFHAQDADLAAGGLAHEGATASYRQTALSAIKEVEDQLTTLQTLARTLGVPISTLTPVVSANPPANCCRVWWLAAPLSDHSR